MPLPKLLARVNRRVFNPREVRKGTRPVLTHVGRTSGTAHRTPMDAHRVNGGFVFFPLYGPECDWVRNVMAAGTARLRIDGEDIALDAPRLVGRDEVAGLVPADVKLPPGPLGVTDFLRMDCA